MLYVVKDLVHNYVDAYEILRKHDKMIINIHFETSSLYSCMTKC